MTDIDVYSIQTFAADMAIRAGRLISSERRGARLSHDYKRGVELVTSADLNSDDLIRSEIVLAYPNHRILSEESSPDLADLSGPLWIIDPIDGTVNYAQGHHQVAISIGFALDGRILTGVVHSPFQGETFTAVLGAGATLNGEAIRASEQSDLKWSLIGTGFAYERNDLALDLRRLEAVLRHCRDLRRIGAASLDLCWVAMGRLEGFYETLKPWDFAAGALVAREAGARVGHLGPIPADLAKEFYGKDLVVAGPAVFDQLVRILQEASEL